MGKAKRDQRLTESEKARIEKDLFGLYRQYQRMTVGWKVGITESRGVIRKHARAIVAALDAKETE